MGVPRLFPWFRYTYPDNVVLLQEGQAAPWLVDGFYLDGNAILHPAMQRVLNYGPHKSYLMDPYGELTDAEKLLKVYELFFESILQLTRMVQARQLIYLALDGTAPIAKQNQQRQRRFMSAQRPSDESGVEVEVEPSVSNQITPGTQFMNDLSDYIQFHIRNEMNQGNSLWRRLKIVYSPSSTPGEGEHKLLKYIRHIETLKKSTNESFTHAFFSPDADILILSMTSYAREIYWVRSDPVALGYYQVSEVGPIGLKMAHDFGLMTNTKSTKNAQVLRKYAIQNFAFLGFFVGNDFLPRIQMFLTLDEGLDHTISLFKTFVRNHGEDGWMVKDSALLKNGLTRLIETYAKGEQGYLTSQVTDPNKQPPEERFINHTLQSCLAKNDQGQLTIDMILYRQAYYTKAGVDSEDVPLMCHDYIKTLYWIYRYYTDELPSWTWSYKYHYAPLMTDLALYLEMVSDDEWQTIMIFDKAQPSHPYQQLLSVLPPSDASYLPEEYRWWVGSESPLVRDGYYPSHVEVDCEGKMMDHQCIALLPFLDNDIIRSIHDQLLPTLESSTVRQLTDFNFEYWVHPHRKVNYSNQFGRVEGTHARRKLIPM